MVSLLKFFHLLIVLSLLGSTSYCLILIGSRNFQQVVRLSKSIFVLALLGFLTGLLLVYPKHYTFHTPWIQAAVVFATLFSLGIFFFTRAKNQTPWLWGAGYGGLILILLALIHGAVTKSIFY